VTNGGQAESCLTVVAHELRETGGQEKVTLRMVEGLLARGWSVRVVARRCDLPAHPNLRVLRVRGPRRPAFLGSLWFFLAGSLVVALRRRGLVNLVGPVVPNRADVATAHFCHSAFERVRRENGFRRASRSGVLYRGHELLASGFFRLCERLCYRPSRVGTLVAVSHRLADELKACFPSLSDRIEVVENGVDVDAFRRRSTDVRGTAPTHGRLVALFVGGDWPRKGVAAAIEAVSRAPGWCLWVVGAGDAGRYDRLADDLGADVWFAGTRDDPAEVYAAADAFLLPSSYEPFGLVVLEAAAARLPVVVSPETGAAGLFDDGETGFVRPRDAESISGCLRELEDPDLRERVGEAGSQVAAACTWERAIDAYAGLYARLASSRRESSLARVFVRGAGLNALTLGVTMASGVLAARALSPVGRGELAAILIGPNLAPYAFSFGCQRAASYRVARTPGDAPAVLATWAVILVPASILAIAVLEALVPALLHAQSDSTQLLGRLWAATAVIALYGRLANGVLLGDHDFTVYLLSGFAQPVLVTAIYVGLWLHGGLTVGTALLANLVAGVVSLGIAGGRLLTRHGLARPRRDLAGQMLRYGVRAQGSEASASVNSRLDALMLPSMVGAAQVGYYSVAASISWIANSLSGIVAPIILPAAARRGRRGTKAVVASVHVTAVGSVAIGALIALTAPVLVPAIYGPGFSDAILPLEILVVGTVLYSVGGVLISGLDAMNRPWLGAVPQMLGAVVTVLALLVALPLGAGIVGAAIVSTAAYGLVFLVALLLHRRSAGLTWADYRPSRSLLGELGAGRLPHPQEAVDAG
jgi:glycosyltransferase involved in cell wall biosynthesis/O-antigen/teichoic acid export membrane protein